MTTASTNPPKDGYIEFQYEAAMVPTTSISYSDRIRKDYGDLDDVSESIKLVGLIHPIAVKRVGDGYKLLAGARRFHVLIKRGVSEVPVRIYPESIDEETMRLIEKIENVTRKDFTPYEEACAVDAIHKAQVAKYGEKIHRKRDAQGWSKKDTERLIGQRGGSGAVADKIKLVEAAREHPHLKKAKTMEEARRLYKQLQVTKEQAAKAIELSKKAEEAEKGSEEKALLDLVNRYQIKDAYEGMASLPSASFDIIDMDPDYGINFDKLREDDGVATAIDFVATDPVEYLARMKTAIEEAYRLLDKDGWLLFWHAMDPWHKPIVELLRKAGFKLSAVPAIWHKVREIGASNCPAYLLTQSFECFFYCRKGGATIERRGRSNVFSYPIPHPTARIHPTEKPVKMMDDILTTFAHKGARLLVPFLGSGNTLLAANNSYMKSQGFDLSENYKNGYTVRVFKGPLHHYK